MYFYTWNKQVQDERQQLWAHIADLQVEILKSQPATKCAEKNNYTYADFWEYLSASS